MMSVPKSCSLLFCRPMNHLVNVNDTQHPLQVCIQIHTQKYRLSSHPQIPPPPPLSYPHPLLPLPPGSPSCSPLVTVATTTMRTCLQSRRWRERGNGGWPTTRGSVCASATSTRHSRSWEGWFSCTLRATNLRPSY